MNRRRDDVALFVARLCMASLFLWSGSEKLFDLPGAAAFATSHSMPFAAQLMPVAVVVEIGAGLALVTGLLARPAAVVLALWMLVLGPWFHQFWHSPPAIWQATIDDFFHHFVMIGGMIYVAVCGPGGFALGRR